MGSLCKRVKRNRKHFLTAWRLRKRRYPKGLRALTARKHYVPRPQGNFMRPPGGSSIAYQGHYVINYLTGHTVKVAR